MSICTGNGDKGFSALADGKKICKSELCFETLGNIDELISCLGLAKAVGADRQLTEDFQKRLVKIMSYLASGNEKFLLTTEEADIAKAHEEAVLTAYILPGKSEKNARLDFARTVARRAERSYIRLHREKPLDQNALVFLNRLSDALFIMANEK